jgi:hypothetical protein
VTLLIAQTTSTPFGVDQLWPTGCCCVISLVVVGLVVASIGQGRTCGICGDRIKRRYYSWKIEGKKMALCPNCNRGLERRKSRDALERRFGR